MAKRIAFLGDDGGTYEAIPFDNTYPTGAISISEASQQAGDLALFEKTDVSDSFDTSGRAKIYKSGVYVKTLIFDETLFRTYLAGPGLKNNSSDGSLEVQVDNSTIEVASDIVGVKDGGITPTKTSFAEDYA